MDLKQIEYILKIAEEKSITRAAEKLFLTQPALNQQLLRLEKELGTPLFIRGRKHLELTPAGEIYIKNAKIMLDLKRETYREISDIAGVFNHSLKIGLTPERGLHIFSAVYPAFHERYPHVILQPFVMNVKEQQAEIASGNLDFGLVTLSDEDKDQNHYRLLDRSGFVLAAPKQSGSMQVLQDQTGDGGLLSPEALTLLKEEPFVLIWKGSTLRRSIDNIFEQAGFVPRILFETESNITIVRMVQAGICHAILPAYYAVPAKNVVYSRLDSPFTFDVAACCRKKKKPDQASEYFLSLVQDFLNQNPVYQSYDR
ncbi:MAG: LysR family transcriptional regulator [Lachnospiraceae bacterium]|nr:LysR family transcriptional regulator [Lachnospiraceae bacterium]